MIRERLERMKRSGEDENEAGWGGGGMTENDDGDGCRK